MTEQTLENWRVGERCYAFGAIVSSKNQLIVRLQRTDGTNNDRWFAIGELHRPLAQPVKPPLQRGTRYYIANPAVVQLATSRIWGDNKYDHRFLICNLVHKTRAAAVEHAKALLRVSGAIDIPEPKP